MIRDELISRIKDHLLETAETLSAMSMLELSNKWDTITESLDLCTIEQLWSMYKLVEQKTNFKILHCTTNDHCAVQFAGCYVGIEPDGYMHS